MAAKLILTCDHCGAERVAQLESKVENGRVGGFLVPPPGWAYRLVDRPPWMVCACGPGCRLALELRMGEDDAIRSER